MSRTEDKTTIPPGAIYVCKNGKAVYARKGEGRDAAIKRVCGAEG